MKQTKQSLFKQKASAVKKSRKRQPMAYMLDTLREFQKIDNEFPLQYAVCLIEISMNEGLSLTELAQKTNLPLSTVSRIITALSRYSRKGSTHHFIEARVCPDERRKKQLYLTTGGRKTIQRLSAICQ